MGRAGWPLSPPAVTARARTRLPNSTTATKLLPLVPYQRFVPGFCDAPNEASEPQLFEVKPTGNARRLVVERRVDQRRDALEAVDLAPRHAPAAEVALKPVEAGVEGLELLRRR